MPKVPSISLKSTWRRMGRFDRLLLVFVLVFGLIWLLELLGIRFLSSGPLSFILSAAFVISVPYLALRWVLQNRDRLLWSLRNRLVVAYVFIAVVPTVLVLALGWLAAGMFYQQVAAYLVYADMQQRIQGLSEAAEEMLAVGPSAVAPSVITGARRNLPGLQVEFSAGEDLLRKQEAVIRKQRELEGNPGIPIPTDRFAGLVQEGERVWLRAVAARGSGRDRLAVMLSVELNEDVLSTLVPDLGPLRLTITRVVQEGETRAIGLGDKWYLLMKAVDARNRTLAPATAWMDLEVSGYPKLEVTCLDVPPCGGALDGKGALIGQVTTRTAMLNTRLFSQPGEVGGLFLRGLIVLAILFFVLEVSALIAGIRLTRTITQAVADLYGATEHVQAGDLTHRVRTRERDQLGALGESFNAMIGSVAGLIEEQKRRQRLENELAIAQQVQAQLFPQQLPSVPRMELAAVCRAARVVSGDYYDFIPLGPNRLGIAIADISGKGISAALLMASLQAALRSQVLLDGKISENTDELVTRLNRHLFLNTSDERYATFFYAHYDSSTRRLHYTNAGHLPPIYVVGEEAKKLEAGGMVVGLFDNCSYERGDIVLEPGSVLVAYSDGLVEPENVYGEQFGIGQLTAEVVRHRHLPPQELAESLMQAVEEWAGTQEQADDMTVIVVKVT